MNINYLLLQSVITEFLRVTKDYTGQTATDHRETLSEFAIEVLEKQGRLLEAAINISSARGNNCDAIIADSIARKPVADAAVEIAFKNFVNAMDYSVDATTHNRLIRFTATIDAILRDGVTYAGLSPVLVNYLSRLHTRLIKDFGVPLKSGGNGGSTSNYASTLATSSSSSVP